MASYFKKFKLKAGLLCIIIFQGFGIGVYRFLPSINEIGTNNMQQKHFLLQKKGNGNLEAFIEAPIELDGKLKVASDKNMDQLKCKHQPIEEKLTDQQKFSRVENRPVYVFSAYFDNRTELRSPVVRVIAAGLQVRFNKIEPMFCKYWYQDGDAKYFSINGGKADYEVIYNSMLWPTEHTIHFIKCNITKNAPVPLAVSLVPEPCWNHTHILPIRKTWQRRPIYNFSLCISPLHGNVPVLQLIEFIEMHKIFGVQKFTFYKYQISDQTRVALDYYIKQGTVDLIEWDIPKVKANYHMQRVCLNDCLYRNMAWTKYLGIFDLDEFAVPKIHGSWKELFENLTAKNPAGGSFHFQHAYFRRNNTLNTTLNLITQNSRWRTHVVIPAGFIRCKTVYKPQTVYSTDIHFAYRLLPGFKTVMLNPDIAMLHHYRSSPMSYNVKINFTYIEDKTMVKYGEKLLYQVKHVLSTTNLQ